MSVTNTTIQANVNNYYFKSWEDYEAHKSEILNNSTIYIDDGGPDPMQEKLTTTSVSDGTIVKVIGFDSLGNVIKGTVEASGSQVSIVDWSLEVSE